MRAPSAEPPASPDPSPSHLPLPGERFSGSLEPRRARENRPIPPQAPLPVAPSAVFPPKKGSPSFREAKGGTAAVPAAHAVQVPELDRGQEEQQRQHEGAERTGQQRREPHGAPRPSAPPAATLSALNPAARPLYRRPRLLPVTLDKLVHPKFIFNCGLGPWLLPREALPKSLTVCSAPRGRGGAAAATLRARLLGRGARSSLPPYKVCGAPGRRQGAPASRNSRPGLPGGLFGIPPVEGSQPRAACTRGYRAPSTCRGSKGECVQGSSAALSRG